MSMSAQQSGYFPVQEPSHRSFFSGGFCVEIDDDDISLGINLFHHRFRRLKGTIDGLHKSAPLDIQDPHFNSAFNGMDNVAFSRKPARIVDGSEQIGVVLECGENLIVIPNMVAAGDNVDADRMVLSGEGFGHPFALMGVFTVGDDNVGVVFFYQSGEIQRSYIQAGFANDVGDEEDYEIIVFQIIANYYSRATLDNQFFTLL